MAYELPEQHAEITWEDGSDLHGLEVTLSLDAPVDLLFRLQDWESITAKEQRELMLEFGDSVLVTWNLTYRGNSVPATGAGMLSQPMRLMVGIMIKWAETVNAVPLGETSNGGGGSVVPLATTGT